MRPIEYVTVFDVTTAGFKGWGFVVLGLFFITLGLALLVIIWNRIVRNVPPTMAQWYPTVILGFAALLTTWACLTSVSDYRSAVAAMETHQASLVEGVVTNFHPMPRSGHGSDSFYVEGVRFAFSDFVSTAGFNQTESHGGPIHAGLRVRIWHTRGEILRLDIPKE